MKSAIINYSRLSDYVTFEYIYDLVNLSLIFKPANISLPNLYTIYIINLYFLRKLIYSFPDI